MWCDTESHQLFHPLNSTLFPDLPLLPLPHTPGITSLQERIKQGQDPSWESQPRRGDPPTDGLTCTSSHGRGQTCSSMLSRSFPGRPRHEAKQEINFHFLNSPDYFLLSLRPKTNTKGGNHNRFGTPVYSDFGLVWLTHPIGAQSPSWTKSSPAVTLLPPSHHHQIQGGKLAGALGCEEGRGRGTGWLFKATEGAACPEFRWKPTLYPPVFTTPQASFRATWPMDSSSFSSPVEPGAFLVPWCLVLKVPSSTHSEIQPIHDLGL